VRDHAFERAYFEHRLDLALNPDRTFVANRLRHTLSQGTGNQPSPRLRALGRWAEETLAKDLEKVLRSGTPEKSLVFSSLVGDVEDGAAERIRKILEAAFETALSAVRRAHGRTWQALREQGEARLRGSQEAGAPEIDAGLSALAEDELSCVLAGKVGVFRALVASMRKRHEGIAPLKERLRELDDKTGLEARALKRRIAGLERSVAPWTGGKPLRAV